MSKNQILLKRKPYIYTAEAGLPGESNKSSGVWGLWNEKYVGDIQN